MYAIRSYYARAGALWPGQSGRDRRAPAKTCRTGWPQHRRITSYNVCYTKLLRNELVQRDPQVENVLLTLRDGMTLIRKL